MQMRSRAYVDARGRGLEVRERAGLAVGAQLARVAAVPPALARGRRRQQHAGGVGRPQRVRARAEA